MCTKCVMKDLLDKELMLFFFNNSLIHALSPLKELSTLYDIAL